MSEQKEDASKQEFKNDKMISLNSKDCFACKLFSAPLFYLVGAHLSYRNVHMMKTTSVTRLDKFGLVLIPAVLFSAGSYNLYAAYGMLNTFKQERELTMILEQEGVFDGKSESDKAAILARTREMLRDESTYSSVDVGNYINSLKNKNL